MVSQASSAEKSQRLVQEQQAFDQIVKWLSDWHLLAFLDTVGIFDRTDIKLFADVATQKSSAAASTFLLSSVWQTLTAIAAEQNSKSTAERSNDRRAKSFLISNRYN